jgi:hypothetical protein
MCGSGSGPSSRSRRRTCYRRSGCGNNSCWVVDFVHAAARASAHFSALLRLVGSPCVAHINFWTALQASCFPSTLASCLTDTYLSFLFLFVALYLPLFFNSLYVISVTHVLLSFQSNVCLLCTFVILHHFTIYPLRFPLHIRTV